jgi:fermentation-respiration switch protein FrsA (DUF1100 family)
MVAMVERTDVELAAEGGITLRAWLFQPDRHGPNPATHLDRPGLPDSLLMIVATHDTVTPTDLALDAYQRAHPPKQLSLIPGGHFEPYLSQFAQASSDAVA